MIKPAPNIVVHSMGDTDKGDFLKIRHVKLRLQYPDGSMSEGLIHDIVVRSKMDAVVICAYDMTDFLLNLHSPKVWLRSCVRPSVCYRTSLPNSSGNGWELPAGLVDEGETPFETAIRELEEEIGFKVPAGPRWKTGPLGVPAWGSVGIAPELIHFYAVDVTNLERGEPTEDGSPLERYGDCVLVSLDEAQEIGDMKTCLGAYRLRQWFVKNTKKLGDYVTRNRHDIYSPGSKCVAYRLLEPRMLLLQMEDNGVVYLPPPWHAEGLEPRIRDEMGICEIEDQEVFDLIDRAVGSRGVVE